MLLKYRILHFMIFSIILNVFIIILLLITNRFRNNEQKKSVAIHINTSDQTKKEKSRPNKKGLFDKKVIAAFDFTLI
jgi:hypothetical protein